MISRLRRNYPAELANDISAYTGCIAGAIPIADYKRGLLEAGFSNVEVVDSAADLNAYAKLENQSGCCSPPAESAPTVKAVAATVASCCATCASRASFELLLNFGIARRTFGVAQPLQRQRLRGECQGLCSQVRQYELLCMRSKGCKRAAVGVCHSCSAGLCGDHVFERLVTSQLPFRLVGIVTLPIAAREILCHVCKAQNSHAEWLEIL